MSASEQDSIPFDFSGLNLWNMSARAEKHPGFHMPGHAGARGFSKEYAETLLSIDNTELSSTDDLHHPAGPAHLAMCESSRIYGSGETIFVTTGSTTGLHVMLASVVTPGTFLLLPRTIHMSVLNAVTLLDCQYAFIPYPQSHGESVYLYPQLTAEVLLRALELYPQATDILLVSPDYYGQCADLCKLVQTAHDHGCRLLVDEAHGSHFSFAENIFPPDAMKSHADMCVQSLHKTLPALTMAAQIHISSEAICSGRIHASRVWEMLRIFETSSPSFVIAASAEYALGWMNVNGLTALTARIMDIRNFVDRMGPVLGAQQISYSLNSRADRMHLVLPTDPSVVFAPDLLRQLEERGIAVEFADLLRIVLIISPWQSKNDFDVLFDAISDSVSDTCAARVRLPADVYLTDSKWGALLTAIPEKCISLRKAVFGGKEKISIDLSRAEGRICASALAPYPPGIALVWPGEIISKAHIDLLQTLCDLNFVVRGVDNGKIDIVQE